MKKVEKALAELPAPKLDGPEDSQVTLIGWGSTKGVIREAVRILGEGGISTNQLHFKYIHPFHSKEALNLLQRCRKTICVECNYSGQFARHLRAETGFSVDDMILKYDGEPMEPGYIVRHAKAILEGRPRSRDLSDEDAREMAYHYIRSRLGDSFRPAAIELIPRGNGDEPVWKVQLVSRDKGENQGDLLIGIETGATYDWHPAEEKSKTHNA
jgi:hypothetical protein